VQWKLSDEQVAYQESFGDWLGDVAPSEEVRGWLAADDQVSFSARFVKDGWSGVGVAEDKGGQGGGLLELALTAEALGAVAAPSALWLANVLAVPALADRPDLAEQTFVDAPTAVLMSAGSMPDAVLPLELAADGTVSGRSVRVLGAASATQFVAVVVDQFGALRLRLVPAGGGVVVEPRDLLDRSRAAADVTLVHAPSAELAIDADAFLSDCAARCAVLVAADTLGTMQRMLNLAVDYSKQRHQFGVPIGSFQAVKHAAASMLVDIEAARSAIYFTAAAVDGGLDQSDLQAAAVKAQVTAAGVRAADSSLTLHGAIGYTWEHDLHLFYKRAKLNEHLFGSPGRWHERIADGLGLGQ
jgi:alkylation response protein AidB-like acyl-CoA dehydrogenase